MSDILSKQERYRKTIESLCGLDCSKDFHGERREEIIAKSIKLGEKSCQKLEELFNASQDKDEQVFLAFEIKQLLRQIGVLRGEAVDAALLYIMAASQAIDKIEHFN